MSVSHSEGCIISTTRVNACISPNLIPDLKSRLLSLAIRKAPLLHVPGSARFGVFNPPANAGASILHL